MGLLSIFQRNKQAAAKPGKGRGGRFAARQAPLANAQNPADTADAVREARARARTRLMGATVLLLAGVIGFPLLFETQPRPIPVDLPIEIPARNAPGVVDAGVHSGAGLTPTAPAAGSAPTPALTASTPQPESVSYDARPATAAAPAESASTAPAKRSAFASLAAALSSSTTGARDVPASAAYIAPSSTIAQPRNAPRIVRPPVASAAPTPAVAASKPAPVSPAAILAGAPATKPSDLAAGGARFVVQVGAFIEEAKVREARAKVEKLGLKTYTQPVDTPTGKRIRVRVGPYATKAEADKIAAKVKADGLQAAVLAL